MSGRTPTPEQQAAIDAEGEVLVSASAGSGKTFVMIEKIIRLIESGKAEVGSVLAVTFTNLAAAEMKERLRAALVARARRSGHCRPCAAQSADRGDRGVGHLYRALVLCKHHPPLLL